MKNMFGYTSLARGALYVSCGALFSFSVFTAPSAVHAEINSKPQPLVITNAPLPPELENKIYSKPTKAPTIESERIGGKDYYRSTQTPVTRKIRQLRRELDSLQDHVGALSDRLNALQRENERKAADYYATVATINTQLQAGTTPGNPRLIKRIKTAEISLERLSDTVAALGKISIKTTQLASEASVLLETTRSTYGLSGAVEEDHVALAHLEDTINSTVVAIDRVTNTVNDDITRMSTYLSSERDNLRTLSLAVANGDLYGKSLSNRPFSHVSAFQAAPAVPKVAAPVAKKKAAPAPQTLDGPRPLLKIRFDRPDVDYEQPVYLAVNEALQRFPQATFNLVAVQPTEGNAAEIAIESTRARRNAERVLRTLTQMGLSMERIDLSYDKGNKIQANEVHLYIQ